MIRILPCSIISQFLEFDSKVKENELRLRSNRLCSINRPKFILTSRIAYLNYRHWTKEYILISRIVTICHENLEIFAKVIIYD